MRSRWSVESMHSCVTSFTGFGWKRGQNEYIRHGLQIGKDQKGDNQRDRNGYQFNHIGFIDDISIFADTPEGMQKLQNDVQEFTA